MIILIIKVLIGIVALFHLFVLYFEMFAWTTRGPKIFTQFPPHLFEPTKALAANQGLYNGFLAAGLIWSLIISDETWAMHVATFFLCCVSVAGIYGAVTADKKIFFSQALPALIALGLIMIK